MRNPLKNTMPHRAGGFSLVEMMIAMALGLALAFGAGSVYLSTKTAFHHQQQLSALQQNVRMAFEYLGSDVRMAGYMGCFTGQDSEPSPDFAGSDLSNHYRLGVEGYDYDAADNKVTLSSLAPSNITDGTKWKTNNGASGSKAMAVTGSLSIAGSEAGAGLTPGSDVLIVRTVTGRGARLNAASGADRTLSIENVASGKCPDATDRVSGLCKDSHALLASCTSARRFMVKSVSGNTLTVPDSDPPFAIGQYQPANSELLPLQTVVYYVKKSSNGTGTSLYRRVFDGTVAAGVEQELIDGVETMQVRYGRDTTTPAADGVVDVYSTASDVDDWTRVVTVRMSLLLRAPEAMHAGVAAAASGVVAGVTVTYPDARHDRRVFTTTVAVRNKTAYF